MSEDIIELRSRLKKQSRKRKYEELENFFDEEVPESAKSQKSGKAATGRFIVELAHEKMDELKEKKEKRVQGFARYERKLKELAEDV